MFKYRGGTRRVWDRACVVGREVWEIQARALVERPIGSKRPVLLAKLDKTCFIG